LNFVFHILTLTRATISFVISVRQHNNLAPIRRGIFPKSVENIKISLKPDKINGYLTWRHHRHHHHISFMELGQLLTRSGLTYPQVSSKVYHDSFCQLGSSVSLPWVTYFEAFYLYVVSSYSCIPVICPKFVLFLTPLQFVYLFVKSYIYVFMIIPRWILIRVRKFTHKVAEKIKTHILYSVVFARKWCRLWECGKNMLVRQATDDNTTRRMRFACRIIKATNTNRKCVIFTAFRQQKWLRELGLILRYM